MLFTKILTSDKIIFGILVNVCFLFFTCNTPSPKIDCSKFKTGQFLYRYKGPDKIVNFLLIRNSNVQTEINQSTGDTAKYKIVWLDECRYDLKFLRGTEILPANSLQLKKTMTIRTSILKTSTDYYIFQSKSDKGEYVLEDTMWVKK